MELDSVMDIDMWDYLRFFFGVEIKCGSQNEIILPNNSGIELNWRHDEN